MKNNEFWFITLCVILILTANVGLNLPLRIALVANSVVILIDVIRGFRRSDNGE